MMVKWDYDDVKIGIWVDLVDLFGSYNLTILSDMMEYVAMISDWILDIR
jgi:hypothetical protein